MKKLDILEMNRLTPEEFKKAKKIPVTVILDNIRSIYNVGSIFRTSDAFIVEKIILCGITCTPPNAELHKTALGAEFSVEWEYKEDCFSTVKDLINKGTKVFAVEQVHKSTMLNDLKVNKEEHYAIVLGNEVKGVQQAVVDICSGCIEIPQSGTKHSLNVSVAFGIVLWDFFKVFIKHLS